MDTRDRCGTQGGTDSRGSLNAASVPTGGSARVEAVRAQLLPPERFERREIREHLGGRHRWRDLEHLEHFQREDSDPEGAGNIPEPMVEHTRRVDRPDELELVMEARQVDRRAQEGLPGRTVVNEIDTGVGRRLPVGVAPFVEVALECGAQPLPDIQRGSDACGRFW